MKRIAYSFFLILLLSCGTSHYTTDRNRITIVFRDSIVKDVNLLSVRHGSLLVAPYEAGSVKWTSLLPKAEVIPFEKIERVVVKGNLSAGTLFLSGLTGCGLGGLVACRSGCSGYFCNSYGSYPSVDERTTLYYAGGGFLAGLIVGIFISSSDKEYDVKSEANLESLSNFNALYPNDEPPSLQLIQ